MHRCCFSYTECTFCSRFTQEKASVFGLFGGGGGKAAADDDDEKDAKEGSPVGSKELDQVMMAKHKETWDSLDAAKKKRRLQEFLKVRVPCGARLCGVL